MYGDEIYKNEVCLLFVYDSHLLATEVVNLNLIGHVRKLRSLPLNSNQKL
jgi:hypothetical protein